jgi:hypothetical protein
VLESLVQDVKFGAKLLIKERGFSLTALFTLALCIGANAAIFTVIHSVLLRPLPFPGPDQLVVMDNRYPGVGVNRGANGVPDYLDRKKEDAFEDVALVGFSGYDLGMEGSPERVPGLYVTPSFFCLLRASPARGRAFTEQEAVLGTRAPAFVGVAHGYFIATTNHESGAPPSIFEFSGARFRRRSPWLFHSRNEPWKRHAAGRLRVSGRPLS